MKFILKTSVKNFHVRFFRDKTDTQPTNDFRLSLELLLPQLQ
jgi:hypothetical protein